MTRPWMAPAASLMVYLALTAVAGRELLWHLSTLIIHDSGDPLLTASILHWNAWVLPLSDAWWQFPIFYPTADTLAFSEHLLGLSAIATPIEWVTRDPIATANLVALATFPLSGIAMYLLVHRLNGSAAGAFVAGLAFAFAPFRAAQLPHVQMLAAFWAPLALLGLHAYLETRRRRWLVLYGAAWLLQVTANAYFLVFFSVLTGLWVAWFIVLRRDWRALAHVTVATLAAAVPLVPILSRYIAVHARHGFVRDITEVQHYSADLFGVLCASEHLWAWGWLRIGCRIEGELFPGLTVALLSGVAVAHTLGWWPRLAVPRTSMATGVLRGLLVATAVAGVSVALAVAASGPLRYQLGPVRLSSSSVAKPFVIALASAAVAFLLSPRALAAVRRSSTLAFYLAAAGFTWVLALGPTLRAGGALRGPNLLPFAALMQLPGANGVRVPARFWMMSTLCLAVVAGLTLPIVARRRAALAGLATIASLGLLADGWVPTIQSAAVPPAVPAAEVLRDTVVLALPAGVVRDIAPQYAAVVGGWRTVNGYSGYEPAYYPALLFAMQQEQDDLFEPFRNRFDLHVIVEDEAPRLRELVERQPGVVRVARSTTATQYRLPKRGSPLVAEFGRPWPIARVESACESARTALTMDGDPSTRWYCGPQRGVEALTVDLGRPSGVGAVRHGLGRYTNEFPQGLVIETSLDGQAWQAGWAGSVARPVIEAGLAQLKNPAPVFTFPPRPARYVRLRQTRVAEQYFWTVADVEIGSGQP